MKERLNERIKYKEEMIMREEEGEAETTRERRLGREKGGSGKGECNNSRTRSC